jgi:hypothetical protein
VCALKLNFTDMTCYDGNWVGDCSLAQNASCNMECSVPPIAPAGALMSCSHDGNMVSSTEGTFQIGSVCTHTCLESSESQLLVCQANRQWEPIAQGSIQVFFSSKK